jgi:hypothetical protein
MNVKGDAIAVIRRDSQLRGPPNDRAIVFAPDSLVPLGNQDFRTTIPSYDQGIP